MSPLSESVALTAVPMFVFAAVFSATERFVIAPSVNVGALFSGTSSGGSGVTGVTGGGSMAGVAVSISSAPLGIVGVDSALITSTGSASDLDRE